MTEVYVVFACYGEYEDYRERPVRAFSDKAKADDLAVRATAAGLKVKEYTSRWWAAHDDDAEGRLPWTDPLTDEEAALVRQLHEIVPSVGFDLVQEEGAFKVSAILFEGEPCP